ncbi:hypothetical protein RvY_05254 [Ramazzottius varieornatus]|uniref:Uncharacterized protein n=1 Tax=Ramazzottius varieornatus TaxID=947166 RepID=A0A1D1UUG9_RAMVA|nr:hypothetical protein RvY_05254 [Ramazzottius varieornatus]
MENELLVTRFVKRSLPGYLVADPAGQRGVTAASSPLTDMWNPQVIIERD